MCVRARVTVPENVCVQGVSVGPPRLPKLPMAPAAFEELKADLAAIGFFEWA